jgi:hypothetical protein
VPDAVPLVPAPVEPMVEPGRVDALDACAPLALLVHTSVTRSPELTPLKRAAALLETLSTTGEADALDDELAGGRTVIVIPDGSTETISAETFWPAGLFELAAGEEVSVL